MKDPTDLISSQRIPEGFRAIPLEDTEATFGLQLCVVIRDPADDLGGVLIRPRTETDAHVLLGALMDAGGQVHQWVEILIQSMASLAALPGGAGESMTNQVLDARWQKMAKLELAAQPGGVLVTGAETQHPPPCWLMPSDSVISPILDEKEDTFDLCTDDATLEAAGLPAYRSSRHRYLVSPDGTRFIPVTPDAPVNDRTVSLRDVVPDANKLIAVNPEGGLMRVRPWLPVTFPQALDILSGGKWEGVRHGRAQLPASEHAEALSQPDHPNRLFFTSHGLSRSLAEIFHLKIHLLCQAFSTTSDLVRAIQTPLFTIDDRFFRVGFAGAEGIPLFWNTTVKACGHSAALPLPIQSTQISCFLPPPADDLSIYRPSAGETGKKSQLALRIREVTESQAGHVVQCTVQVGEEFPINPRHLVWLRIPLDSRHIDLYGRLESDDALARGEARFRSYDMQLDPRTLDVLTRAAGVPIEGASITSRPIWSAPCDLYALAVLATRTLLTDQENTLPVALDEMMSLAREAGARASSVDQLPETIQAMFKDDPRWRKTLGPHRLTTRELDPAEAAASIPRELWSEALAVIARMFPGLSPLSISKGLDEGRPGTYHQMFVIPTVGMENLARKTRGLILSDWNTHREVHAVLDKLNLG